MYSILIVDDETITRQGLIGFIRQMGSEYAEVTEASLASQAIEYAKSRQFDIIITDIRMPGMDGLDLLTALDAMQSQAVYIVLSGYGDFSYAQRAIKLGVLEYLLKPLDKGTFFAALKHAETQLISRDTRIREQYLRSWDSIIKAYVYQRADEISLRNIPFTFDGIYKVAVFQFPYTVTDGQIRLQNACGKDALVLGSYPDMIYMLLDTQKIVPRIPGCFSVGESDDCQGAAQLAGAYRQAYCRARAIVYHLPAGENGYGGDGASAETEKLLNTVRAGNERSAAEALDAWMSKAQSVVRCPFAIDCELTYIASELEKLLGKRAYKTSVQRLKTPQSYLSWDQIIIDLRNTLQSALDDQVIRLENSSHKRMIAATLNFLHTHYQLFDLSLSDAAEHAGVSSTYLSSLFKQEQGASFIDFLTQLRLDKAKELLVDSTEKIQKISHCVGYRDVKYFNRLFKKHIGVTPTEYRRFS